MKQKKSYLLLVVSTLAVLSLTLGLMAPPAQAADVWDSSFFTTQGEELIEAADAATRSEVGDVVVLLDEGSFSFDSQGRCTTRYRIVYRIMTAAGLEKWSTVTTSWSRWHEERPILRARVITPDGVEHRLAQETISDAPEQGEDPDVFSDRRVIRAPLPAVTVGAVVEEEVTVKETAPSFAAGEARHFFFGRGVKTCKTRLSLEYPINLPIRYVVRLLPDLDVDKSERGGRNRVVFEMGAMKPLKPLEPGLPVDVARWPEVAFTTAKNWEDVAISYGEIIERQIGGSDMTSFVRGIVGDTTRREVIVQKLLARLHKDIRYTGIEFGNSSIVPHTPRETLDRGYGDCKDQAALLVKMLRAAWVPAYVALIRSGMGEDIDPELPGIGDLNHAIVYIPGAPSLWIDPTNRFRPAGELPLVDQGRQAMIAGAGFSSLLATPESRSTDNTEIATCDFFLPEVGGARVVETTRATGSIAGAYRRDYGTTDEKEVRKHLQKYVESAYLTKKIEDLKISDPNDLAKPITIRLEMKDAARGFTDGKEASTEILPSVVIDRLPALISGEDQDNASALRKHDYLLPEPYVFEVSYRIVPPPGYRLKTLPDSGASPLGPMSFSKKFRRETDGSVTATLRLDTGKRRMTPQEFDAAQRAVRALRKEKAIVVTFEQTAQALIAAGNVREGLAELRHLASLHPDEALHHIQLARALLKLGMGGAARKEAARAVEVEPESYLAHQTLGYTLQHDLIGRLRGKGYDRAGALAEYRKAKELKPDDYVTRGDLAILLEYDEDGVRYSRKADVDGAIKEYYDLRGKLKKTVFDQNLLLCLLESRRWKELKTLALSVEDVEDREKFLLTAIAADEGVPAALKEAKVRIPDASARAAALEVVASRLVACRRHQDAADVLDEAAKGNANAASLRSRARVLRKVQRFDQVLSAEKGPTAVVRRMMAYVTAPEVAPDALWPLFSSGIREEIQRVPEVKESLREAFERTKTGEGKESYADIAVSGMGFESEGNDRIGYRINITFPGPPAEELLRVYVAKEGGQYRIIGHGEAPELVGIEVLRRLQRRDFTGAAALLDWVHQELSSSKPDDPLAENPFRLLWQPGETDPQRMRLAASALVSSLPAPQVVPFLKEQWKFAEGETRRAIDISLLRAYYSRGKYRQLLEHCDRIAASYPLSGTLFHFTVMALRSMHRWDEMASLAQQRLKAAPMDPLAITVLGQSASARNDLDQSAKWYRLVEKTGKADALVCNELAWLGLFGRADLAESLKLGERAVSLTDGKQREPLHTLSALYAESGDPSGARQMILKAIAASKEGMPESHDWYVLGRIAEEYGEMDEAREAYAKVSKPDPDTILATSTYVLARKRLALSQDASSGI